MSQCSSLSLLTSCAFLNIKAGGIWRWPAGLLLAMAFLAGVVNLLFGSSVRDIQSWLRAWLVVRVRGWLTNHP
jgi:hypothetical protein